MHKYARLRLHTFGKEDCLQTERQAEQLFARLAEKGLVYRISNDTRD